DKCIYVMTPEYGAATQLEKIEMLEVADFVVLNKFEKPRSEDALRDIRKQYRRNHNLFAGHPGSPSDDELPIYGTMASKFNDMGVNALFHDLVNAFGFDVKKTNDLRIAKASPVKDAIIPPERSLYLRELSRTVKSYNDEVETTAKKLEDYQALEHASSLVSENS